ncbi:hypothetical protein BOTBODRAFT_77617, partial [Botryobasidium botryosum FD-172 SS1]
VYEEEENDPTHTCIPEHAFYCFDTLYTELTSAAPIEPMFEDLKYPLFVTWNTRSSRAGGGVRLRGCIGTFEPVSLREGLAEYALISAFKDRRFTPIQEKELPRLECGISLLTDFEDAENYLDWTVGKHGIYITFPDPLTLPVAPPQSSTPTPMSSSTSVAQVPNKPSRSLWGSSARSSGRTYNATYLPEIAPAQGWSKVEAVDSAIRKAGWEGRIGEELRRAVKLRRYQSRKIAVGWDEYVAWREQME